MINACAILGGSTYVNSWLSINLLVILVSLLIGAFILAISRILPSRFSGKVTSAVRTELTQALLSAVIIMVLLGMASAACSISTSMSSTVTGSALSPFQFADYYIGNLTMNSGLSLLSKVYFTSVEYSIESTIFEVSYGSILNGYNPLAFAAKFNGLSVSFATRMNLGKVFKILSDVYMSVFAMVLITTIGALYLQWVMLPLLEYTAFIVVLPVALVMRSLSFVGGNLRNTANAFLAIAIAAYLVYPLMVGFDGYAVSWIFSANNPSYKYLSYAYTFTPYSPSAFFAELPSSSLVAGNPSTAPSYLQSFVSSAGISLNPLAELGSLASSVLTAPYVTNTIIEEISKFMFVGIFMFAINIGVTAGLAMGVAKALNSGVEGASTFWGNL
ncbi:MAG: hypothetical protein ACP5UH_00125 [Candidatus Micrarchaeia archaeon]